MKKLFPILLCLLMVLSLAACGNKEAAAPEDTADTEVDASTLEDTTGADMEAGLANPWVDYDSLEEINAEVGCNLCKPAAMGVNDEHFAVGDMGEYKMAQYDFSIGGYTYTFRCAPVTEDISGIWDDEVMKAFAEPVGSEVETVTGAEVKAARWMTIDGQYVLSVTDNGEMDEETFAGVAGELYSLTTTDMFNENGENG